jgi:putative Mg2+ transporter-C (MgtC) family protein
MVFVAAASALPAAESWRQVAELGVALLLSAIIGLEREIRQKNAGLLTHTPSRGGRRAVHAGQQVRLHGSPGARPDSARPVPGGGPDRQRHRLPRRRPHFVRRDAVRGLTSAAGVWITAAIGSAAGAGLPLLAALATADDVQEIA